MNKYLFLFKKKYPLYLIEAWGLGVFMISASIVTILFQHPDLILVNLIESDSLRRLCIGIAMGLTATCIINSTWGKKSGAHINPAVTLTMFFLKKISSIDIFYYIIFQLLGGIAGVGILALFFKKYMAHPSVQYIVTVPGKGRLLHAMIGESIISFVMIFVILAASTNLKTKKWTGYITGILIANFVFWESPYSGFSMNPSRTIASAIFANIWTAWPLYMLVPPISMIFSAFIFTTLFHKEN